MFKALADPTRRFLLDRLFARDGRTLTELESEVEMTRFGVMKHLRVLEDAGLVVTRRSGREKLHFLNPVPIRLIHDRWIDKYTERQVSALADLKNELEGRSWHERRRDERGRPRSTGSYIKATPQAIWDAITRPEWTAKYGYGGDAEYDLRARRRVPGIDQRRRCCRWAAPDVAIDGEVIEADPPSKLVQTWRMVMDDPTWPPRASRG